MSNKIEVKAKKSFELDHEIKTPSSKSWGMDLRTYNLFRARGLVEAVDEKSAAAVEAGAGGDGEGDGDDPLIEKAGALVNQNQTEVLAALGDIDDVELLRAAIEIESAGKNRKGVSEALAAALAEAEKA